MTTLRGGVPAPENPIPVLPLRRGVLYPATQLTLTVGRQRSLALVRAVHVGDVIGLVSQKDGRVADPDRDGLYDVGTYAHVLGLARRPDGTYQMTVEGIDTFRLGDLVETDPYWRGSVDALRAEVPDRETVQLLAEALAGKLRELEGKQGGALEELVDLPSDTDGYAEKVAAGLQLDLDDAQKVLEASGPEQRLEAVIEVLGRMKARADAQKRVEKTMRNSFGKRQREAVLREQLAAIRKELGDGEDDKSDVERLRERLDGAELPEEARKIADRELKRLEAVGESGAEANVIRTYLETLADLPWTRRAEARDAIDPIAEKLDEDHHGLDDVKKRILEHMAVHQLAGRKRGTVLCLVGPPGVGKTSLGQSIADATGRPFVRISLGGVRDEAEIRGHRRTYVGALPGRIVSGMRKAGVKNPVMLLDEVDKLAHGWSGWPEAALLEVLDPEQNGTFTDHYLETEFDLSEVMFIATANTLETLSAPLRDRLEIIEVSGYTQEEKRAIARKHLLPKRVDDHGIGAEGLDLTDVALGTMIAEYTREAGVRQLDREITRVCRGVALRIVREKPEGPVVVDDDALRELLGKPRFRQDVAERTSLPGVATGLAWTPVGGDILFVETSRMPGKGRIEITGQLGDVMKESARAALSYVRSHADELGVSGTDLESSDLHIHVPAGAVPKDGPSAGVTMFTALTSLLTGRPVRGDTAMTGECTLRGRVLPVGGIKAKVLAAHRAGIRRVILPEKNAPDIDDVPETARADLELILVSDMSEALEAALEDAAVPVPTGGDAPGVLASFE